MRWILTSLFLLATTVDSKSQCDDNVNPSKHNPLHYRQFSDRCEGFYRSKVSSESLELLSCTLGSFRFKNEKGEVISLQVPAADEKRVRVHAQGLPVDLYYRMDTELSGKQKLEWAADDILLRHDRTKRSRNIGITAYSGKGAERVYMPVKARSKLLGAPPDSVSVIIKLVGHTRLNSLYWKLDNAQYQTEEGPFPDGRPILISFPVEMLLESKEYSLEIRYRPENGGRTKSRRFKLKI